MPHEETPWLSRPLRALTGFALHAPRTVVVGGLVSAAICVALAVGGLGFRANRLDLLNRESEFNQRWLSYLQEFGDQDDVLLVVEAAEPEAVEAALEELTARLSLEGTNVAQFMPRRDLSGLRTKGLHYLSEEQLSQVDALTAQAVQVVKNGWSSHCVPQVLTDLQSADRDAASSLSPVRQYWFRRYLQSLTATLQGASRVESEWSSTLKVVRALENRFRAEYLLADGGRLGFLLLQFEPSAGRSTADCVRDLRNLVRGVETGHPKTVIGMTGMPVLEVDEMVTSQADSAAATSLSLLGVACVFIAGFGGFRRPLLAVAVLVIALAWTFGYITLGIGHLNILSAAFGIILVGLVIDFGIHYIAEYGHQLKHALTSDEALLKTSSAVGPGIVTGGVTTALAFSTTTLTEFTGVAELGMIAAGGIVLCLVAAIVLLPALLKLYDIPVGGSAPQVPLRVARFFQPASRYPGLVLVGAGVVTVVVGQGLGKLRYDHNLLNLQPIGSESVELERQLSSRLNRGVWFALSVADNREALLARKQQFEGLEVVAGTEEIVSLLPNSTARKTELIDRIHKRLVRLPAAVPLLPVLPREQCSAGLARAGSGSIGALGPSVEALRAVLHGLSDAEYFARVSHFQQQRARDLRATLVALRRVAEPAAPDASDLPDALTARFIGSEGKHLLRVYGHAGLWEMDRLAEFVRELERIDPSITGHPIQTFYASRQMQKSYFQAAVYSLIAVSVILMVDFRQVRCWLLALVPMALGMVQMLGVLGWWQIPLNPANIIVLPLILGIGIDDGVHVLHDYLRQRKPYRLSNATATAIVITSATTMIGFGSMMFASHQGLRSLGQVLTIGIFCCMVSSLVVLPVLLSLLDRGFSHGDTTGKISDSP